EFSELTTNGEAVIISRTGRVISAQKRLGGLIFAGHLWAKDPPEGKWKQLWPEEPYIEAYIVQGVSDDPRVIMTIDNVDRRSSSDVIYTSHLWANKLPSQRRELSSILASASRMLWNRTQVGSAGKGTSGKNAEEYFTHSTEQEFIGRHPR